MKTKIVNCSILWWSAKKWPSKSSSSQAWSTISCAAVWNYLKTSTCILKVETSTNPSMSSLKYSLRGMIWAIKPKDDKISQTEKQTGQLKCHALPHNWTLSTETAKNGEGWVSWQRRIARLTASKKSTIKRGCRMNSYSRSCRIWKKKQAISFWRTGTWSTRSSSCRRTQRLLEEAR